MKMLDNAPPSLSHLTHEGFVHLERRASSKRRKTDGRRSQRERRLDSRGVPVNLSQKVKTWLQSLIHLRLGVDRRKEIDRRRNGDRRQQQNRSILTREELAALLS